MSLGSSIDGFEILEELSRHYALPVGKAGMRQISTNKTLRGKYIKSTQIMSQLRQTRSSSSLNVQAE